jgi:hypothetical protein
MQEKQRSAHALPVRRRPTTVTISHPALSCPPGTHGTPCRFSALFGRRGCRCRAGSASAFAISSRSMLLRVRHPARKVSRCPRPKTGTRLGRAGSMIVTESGLMPLRSRLLTCRFLLAEHQTGVLVRAVKLSYVRTPAEAPFLLHCVAHSTTKRWEDRQPSCFTFSRW